MDIRSATARDIDQIIRVATESWDTDYAEDILTSETAEEAATDWYDAERLRAELDQEQTTLLVVERDGDVVGFTHATWSEETGDGYILRLYVHPDHRRAGVGQSLLTDTCRTLAGHGAERINAMVLSANDPGVEFYEQFGFEFVDEHETQVGDETLPESRFVLDSAALATME
jgi:ribosomal protein S18 acetylase RimI-like enzyme